MANSAAKNISSDDSHTMVPTLTRLGRVNDPCAGFLPRVVAVATKAIIATSSRCRAATPLPGRVGALDGDHSGLQQRSFGVATPITPGLHHRPKESRR